MVAAIKHPITVPPDLLGPFGKAWVYDRPNAPPIPASLRVWVVEAAWAHPVWHSYLIGVCHLRPLEGCPPAVINLPGATHEVTVMALDPDHPIPHKRPGPLCYLTPLNFAGQWIATDDAAAMAKVEGCVRDILAHNLSPDTDYIQHWIARFSASNVLGDPERAGETRVILGHGTENAVGLVIPPAKRPGSVH